MRRRDFSQLMLCGLLHPILGRGEQALAAGPDPVKVGILHSLSGTMSLSEKWLKDVAVMTIGQINANGGILGRLIQPVVIDPASNWAIYPAKAERLIREHEVQAIFGCWTSISRKRVLPVVESNKSLLFYPVQYEGQEQSPNIVYLGATPNQQSLPAVRYFLKEHKATHFVLIGTDYVYPRTTNRILRAYLAGEGIASANIIEFYTPFSHTDYGPIVARIKAKTEGKDAVIISTINGDSNVAFYAQLAAAGLHAETLPVVAFSIGEQEIQAMKSQDLKGHYAAWSYFMSLDNPVNQAFKDDWRRFLQQKYPWWAGEALTNDPMEATYVGIHLWKQAVEQAGSFAPDAVIPALGGQTFAAPSGYAVRVDARNHHLHKPVFIGRIGNDGQFDVVHQSHGLVPPEPWSHYLAEAPLA
ncbi:MAG: urea ABC transporter substrate-binding protein [Halochromatium sp.]|nr:urea ABC transporter substrate-binding protein [Halochromatium sp.]